MWGQHRAAALERIMHACMWARMGWLRMQAACMHCEQSGLQSACRRRAACNSRDRLLALLERGAAAAAPRAAAATRGRRLIAVVQHSYSCCRLNTAAHVLEVTWG